MQPTIFHIDVNSAFLSWEAAYRCNILGEEIDLRDIPSVIGGDQEKRHGIVLAKSVPTKKYGIQTGEPIVSAIKKCPNLVLASPNFEIYLEASRKFIAYLRKYAVQTWQYSIDEAFCDFSGTEKIYGEPLVFANELKSMIHRDLGFTVNIGVSTNKLLAKMASELKKPNQVISLYPDEIAKKMWPLPVSELFYVGRSSSKTLEKLGIRTIGELAHTDPAILHSHFRSHGDTLYRYANGGDVDLDLEYKPQNKGYGNSTTLPKDIFDAKEAELVLLSLCESVGARMRKDHCFIKVVSISVTASDFTSQGKQATLPSPVNATMEIFDVVCKLFYQVWNRGPIRRLGVGTSHATQERIYQYNLFDMGKLEKQEQADHAIDQIRNVYGKNAIMRASFLSSSKNHMHQGFSTFGSKSLPPA